MGGDMKGILLAGVAGLALISLRPGYAAGLSSVASPPPPSQYNWSGFYIGANVGGGWGTTSANAFDSSGAFVAHTSYDRSGVFGGGQIGYNFVVMPNWLLGAEADVSGADFRGSVTSCTSTGCAHSVSTDDAFGTVRARVGYAWGNLLFYGTGGFAWLDANTRRTIICVGGGCPGVTIARPPLNEEATASGTDAGWALGGGIEWALAPHWSFQAQYLHLQFNDVSRDYSYSVPTAFRHIVSDNGIDTGRVAINYRF
jgi:outer membrane immunogenic protein